MVEKYLFTTNNVADRLVQGSGRLLRSDSKRVEKVTVVSRQLVNEKIVQVAVRKLEKEMDMLTNPVLLQQAREDQQGRSKSGSSPLAQLDVVRSQSRDSLLCLESQQRLIAVPIGRASVRLLSGGSP